MSSADTEATSDDATEVAIPTDEARELLLGRIHASLGEAIVETHIEPGLDLWVRVSSEAWGEIAPKLRNDLGCDFFDFLAVIDWMPSPFGREMDAEVDNFVNGVEPVDPEPMEQGVAGGDTRFQVFARVWSTTELFGFTLKADVPEDLTVGTWIDAYPGASWHEREAWEMYGVIFDGHPDLRKIYLPTEFEGHPGRKDFPLLARRVKPWPGIVDVEAMPGDDADGGDDA